ncbi:hypothetical protein [Corynebacterium sphenisci]|uniref:hypothetical protein n=1 Tax=Corynebacterium sphenisci TaxID=191493 RepID=UPI0012F50508|nr:hypothetical protein [Corynebacterium sphenisci]
MEEDKMQQLLAELVNNQNYIRIALLELADSHRTVAARNAALADNLSELAHKVQVLT